jgi:hypothetical protein
MNVHDGFVLVFQEFVSYGEGYIPNATKNDKIRPTYEWFVKNDGQHQCNNH